LPAAAGFAAPAPIATDRPGWEGALADRIAAELSGDGQQMDLELAPEHLGRLRIRLEMTDGQAQVRFVTETPEAARVIQQNEHRLSESLSRAGLSLGGQETASRDPQGDQRPARGEGVAARFLERPVEGLAAAIPGRAARGLVNLIA
jgi:flagellar hook-length control protein FliK